MMMKTSVHFSASSLKGLRVENHLNPEYYFHNLPSFGLINCDLFQKNRYSRHIMS